MIRRPPRSTLSLHDALPISAVGGVVHGGRVFVARACLSRLGFALRQAAVLLPDSRRVQVGLGARPGLQVAAINAGSGTAAQRVALPREGLVLWLLRGRRRRVAAPGRPAARLGLRQGTRLNLSLTWTSSAALCLGKNVHGGRVFVAWSCLPRLGFALRQFFF